MLYLKRQVFKPGQEVVLLDGVVYRDLSSRNKDYKIKNAQSNDRVTVAPKPRKKATYRIKAYLKINNNNSGIESAEQAIELPLDQTKLGSSR